MLAECVNLSKSTRCASWWNCHAQAVGLPSYIQMAFLYDLSTRYPDGLFTIDVFDYEGRNILEEVSQIFAGEKCAQCQKHLVMNYEVLALLPPTVREIQEGRKERKYYH